MQAADHAITLDPNLAIAWGNRGAILAELGRSAEAIAACDRAHSLNKKDVGAWNGKGKALMNLMQYDGALVAFDQALDSDATNSYTLKHKGLALDELQRYDEALAVYELALKYEPFDEEIWNSKIALIERLGRASDADAARKERDGAPIELNAFIKLVEGYLGDLLINGLVEKTIAVEQAQKLAADFLALPPSTDKAAFVESLKTLKGPLAQQTYEVASGGDRTMKRRAAELAKKRALDKHQRAQREQQEKAQSSTHP